MIDWAGILIFLALVIIAIYIFKGLLKGVAILALAYVIFTIVARLMHFY